MITARELFALAYVLTHADCTAAEAARFAQEMERALYMPNDSGIDV